MACRGILLALTPEQEAELLRRDGDDGEVREHLTGIESAWDEAWLCETDKAWDAMHRAFNDSRLSYTYDHPLQGVIMGGKMMHDDPSYIISFKTPFQVKAIAEAATGVSGADMAARYAAVDPDAYEYPKSDEDRDYTVQWFANVRDFYSRAANAGRSVVFMVDQ